MKHGLNTDQRRMTCTIANDPRRVKRSKGEIEKQKPRDSKSKILWISTDDERSLIDLILQKSVFDLRSICG